MTDNSQRPPAAPRKYDVVRDVIAGLEIFARHGEREVSAEHDVLYAGPSTKDALSDVERDTLRLANWFWDEEVDSWAIFV
jgi:hypothetical protein